MTRLGPAVVGLTWLGAAQLSASHAHAQSLVYEVADACPSRERFEAQVGETCDLSTLRMSVHIQQAGDEYELQLLVQGAGSSYPDQKKERNCDRLVDLAAHVARLVCDPKPANEAEPEPQTEEVAGAEPPAKAEPPQQSSSPPAQPGTDSRQSSSSSGLPGFNSPRLSLGAQSQLGVSPGLDHGVALGFGAELGAHNLGLSVGAWLPRSVHVELEPGNTTDLELNRASAALEDCLFTDTRGALGVGSLAPGVCARVGYHVLSSLLPAGTRAEDYRSWPSFALGLAGALKVSEHLLIEAELGAEAQIGAAPVAAEPFGEVHEFDALTAFAAIRTSWLLSPPAQAQGPGKITGVVGNLPPLGALSSSTRGD